MTVCSRAEPGNEKNWSAMITSIRALFDRARRNFVLSVKSLWLHKLRAFLSVLGIIIGTASVIALMAFGEGSMHDALEDIKRQGATNIIVRSVKPPDESFPQQSSSRGFNAAAYGLTMDDYERIRAIKTVIRHVPLRTFKQKVRFLGRDSTCRVVGTTLEYTEVHQVQLVEGRFLNRDDNEEMKNHAVIGSELSTRLFPFDSPVGESIAIGRHLYLIVGVLAPRMPTGGSGGSQAAEEFNEDVYIPLNTCNYRFGERVSLLSQGSFSAERVALHQLTLTVSDMDTVRPTGDIIRDLLEMYHPRLSDWALTVPLDRLEAAERERNRGTRLLVIIASISLLVGGIGIMNIMLATVTERTREIGIRRALGAKRRDITLQFLTEAVVQTSIGGICGVALGLMIAWGGPVLWELVASKPLPAKIHVPSIFIAFGFSVSVGVLFGLYPAYRAAHLDPIEALRHV